MGTAEKFCLRWNDFESNISGAFRELRDAKDFFDVTLACDDEQMQAHKVILSACSPFFRTILRRNKHEHPLLYLKGVKYVDLVSVLNFMYHGEVNVAQEELNSFLAVAEDLKVKGLTQNSETHNRNNVRSDPPKQRARDPPIKQDSILPKKPRSQPPQVSRAPPATTYQQEDDDIQEVISVKSEPIPAPPETQANPYTSTMVEQAYSDTTQQHQEGIIADPNMEYGEEYADYGGYEGMEGGYDNSGMVVQDGNKDLDVLIAQSMSLIMDESGSRVWSCNICNQTNKDKYNIRIHVETHFPGLEYQCPHCDKQASSREALRKHISRNHKNN